MQINVIPFDPSIISLSAERHNRRSPGIHLSTIIRDRLITAGIQRYSSSSKVQTTDEKHLTFEKGYLWESMVQEYINTPEWGRIEWDFFATRHLHQAINDSIQLSGGHITRPGEQQMDGIYLTPDAINIRTFSVEEWKATAIRAKNLNIPERKPEWLWQAASYARKFGLTRAIIRVWHHADTPPSVQQVVVDWTEEEIESNWKSLLEHYEYMKEKGRVT